MLVVHDKGNLSLSIGHPVVSPNAHKLISNRGHERYPVDVVDMRESMDITLSEFWIGCEESQVNRFL
jgi:hypothetical protein